MFIHITKKKYMQKRISTIMVRSNVNTTSYIINKENLHNYDILCIL